MATHVEKKESRKQMAHLVSEGEARETVAGMFGVSDATVRKACAEYNVRIPKRFPKAGEQACRNLICELCRRPWIFPPYYGQTKCEVCRSIENVRNKIKAQIEESEIQKAQLIQIEKVQQAWQGQRTNAQMGERKGPKPSAIQSQSSDETGGWGMGNADQLIA